MSRAFVVFIVAPLFAGGLAAAQSAPPTTTIGPPGSRPAPPAASITPGTSVSDRSGARVGVVQSIAEVPSGGVNVVVKIDGKLVGLTASTLTLRGGQVVSSQSKQEMLASAGAPP